VTFASPAASQAARCRPRLASQAALRRPLIGLKKHESKPRTKSTGFAYLGCERGRGYGGAGPSGGRRPEDGTNLGREEAMERKRRWRRCKLPTAERNRRWRRWRFVAGEGAETTTSCVKPSCVDDGARVKILTYVTFGTLFPWVKISSTSRRVKILTYVTFRTPYQPSTTMCLSELCSYGFPVLNLLNPDPALY
jgi:hypothetical protein